MSWWEAIPLGVKVIVGGAAVLTAAGVIWRVLIKPLANFITRSEQMVPMMDQLLVAFQGSPEAFKTLSEIAKQFHTDSGTTLRDVINRLEEAAKDNKYSSEALRVEAQAAKELAGLDRAQILRVMMQLDRMLVRMDDARDSRARIEGNTASLLEDTNAAHERAELALKTDQAVPGVAADAAAVRSLPDTEPPAGKGENK